MKLDELKDSSDKVEQLHRFAKWAMRKLGIQHPPRIKYGQNVEQAKSRRTFGTTKNDGTIWVHVGNRVPADIMRTLCHELVHHRQFELGIAHDNMSEQDNQDIEDQANAIAGRMMRDYGKSHQDIYEGRTGSLTHEVSDSLPFAYMIPGLNSGNPYEQYKFGVAIAGARGAQARNLDGIPKFEKTDLPDVFADREVVISFDPHLDTLIDTAMRDLNIRGGKRRVGVKGSRESRDVNAKSPVVGFKGFKK